MKAKETDHKILRFLIRKFAKECHLHKDPVKKTSEATDMVNWNSTQAISSTKVNIQLGDEA